MILNIEKENFEKYNEIFDAGEGLEKEIGRLSVEKPKTKEEFERLKRNIKSYKGTYQDIEKIRKSDRSNIDYQQIEESDRRRKTYHDGVIDCINSILRNFPDIPYFNNISQLPRDKIGEWAILVGEYFQI